MLCSAVLRGVGLPCVVLCCVCLISLIINTDSEYIHDERRSNRAKPQLKWTTQL